MVIKKREIDDYVFFLLKQKHFITPKDLQKKFKIPPNTSTKYLRLLAKEGLIFGHVLSGNHPIYTWPPEAFYQEKIKENPSLFPKTIFK